ncbi:lipopolysaccharide biosynthesis protein, partial [bacterium]|nr:lipopolysaccharide biosynthesis protein [bacterium]
MPVKSADAKRIDTAETLISNSFWRVAERVCVFGTAFGVELLLARNMTPAAFGIIAMITVVTHILLTVTESGIAYALIQKQDADDCDFSTAFYFNLVFCALLYAAAFSAAPWAAAFYGLPEFAEILRWLSLIVMFAGVRSIVYAYAARTMLFKQYFGATLLGTLLSLAVWGWMFAKGLFVWSIVVQQVVAGAASTMAAWLITGWKPRLKFSLPRLGRLVSYGWKLLVADMLSKVCTQFVYLVAGKKLTGAELAVYNRSSQLASGISLTINTSIEHVLFPALSSVQDSLERVRVMTKGTVRSGFYVMAPVMVGVCVACEPLIRLVLSENWLVCVPFVRIFCVMNMFDPINTANLNAIRSLGRSDIILAQEIAKTFIYVAVLFGTVSFGLSALAYGFFIASFLVQMVNAYPNRRLLHYGYAEQLCDALPGLCTALEMGVLIYPITLIGMGSAAELAALTAAGIIVYAALSKLGNLPEYRLIAQLLRK